MKRFASLLAVLLTLLMVGPSPASAAAPDRELLHNGHVDTAHVEWDQETDKPVIKVLWGSDELKDPDSVYIRLGPDADTNGREVSRIKVPNDPRYSFLGKPGDILWSAPQQHYDQWAPVWAGFGSGHSFPNEVLNKIKPETLHLDLVKVDGPGDVNVFANSPNRVHRMFSSMGDDHRMWAFPPGSHSHANWTFTKPGRYTMTWQASVVTLDNQTISSELTDITWLVGSDEQVGLDAGTTVPAREITTPAENFEITDGGDDDAAPVDPTSTMKSCLHHAGGPVVMKGSWQAASGEELASPSFAATSGNSGKRLDRSQGVINVPDSQRQAAPGGDDEFSTLFPRGTEVYHLPGIDAKGQVSQVLDTTGTDFAKLSEATITWDPVIGPKDAVVALTDSATGQPKTVVSSHEPSLHTVMRITQADKQPMEMWFSKPGTYKINGYYTVYGKPDSQGNKQRNYASFTLYYAVGKDAISSACHGQGETLDNSSASSQPASPKPTQPPSAKPTQSPDRPSSDSKPIVLDHGHADVFRVGSTADGGIDLNLKEDVTGEGVLRAPENVLLKVKSAALTKIPAGLPGSPEGYVLPLTQDPQLLWPGWETFDVKRNGFTKVKIKISDVKGPGKVHLFSQGTFGDVQPLLDDAATEIPGTITVAQPSHVHANWVFSKTGVYTMTVQATADKDGKAFQSKPHTYTWVVGDKTALPAPWGKPTSTPTAAAPTPSASPRPLASPKHSVSPAPTRSPSATPKNSAAPKPTTSPTNSKKPCNNKLVLDHGHSDVFRVGSAANKGLDLQVKEDVTGEGVLHTPENVLLAVKDSALTAIPSGYPGAPKGYLLPITQNQDLLWPGWETFDVKRNGFTEVKINVRNVKGPGQVHLFSQNSFGGVQSLLDGGSKTLPGTITVKQPSHVHANWVFTKPGRYQMTVDATAIRDGKTVSTGAHTYTWAVGSKAIAAANTCADSNGGTSGAAKTNKGGADKPFDDLGVVGNKPIDEVAGHSGSNESAGGTSTSGSAAKKEICRPVKVPTTTAATEKKAAQPAAQSASVATEGHFDWGVQLQSGKLISALKDDRSAPATWVDPSSVVMAVGDKANTTAPAGMEFIAKGGTKVWLIGATQVPGVPWLGVNTMHESVVGGTTGPVHMHLDKVTGPGKMAVFMSGTFGGGVGQRVFDNVGGPTSYTVPANTHAHPNWVFTAPGHYAVTVTQTATTKAGKKVSTSGTLHFAVGIDAKSVASSIGKVSASPDADQKAKPGYTIVGRTPDGKPCDLNGMPGTGETGYFGDPGAASQANHSLMAGGLTLIGLAGALLVARRRRG
ncbi:TIGR03773 family transporter-associated surface protein [Cutibacterium sp.]|uniref:TIGR03773 family transporter-associated surface protein n=1 Tax=Cutibacterium sp. TaxID=1912221 RepID=UPI0034C652AB